MQRGQEKFQGVAPRVSARLLPDTAAQDATNAKLLSGDLEAWRQFHSNGTLFSGATVESVYRLNFAWLEWKTDTDAARGPVPGDTSLRLFITNPVAYSTPVWTNFVLATLGSPPYPVTVKPLGVPAPVLGPDDNGGYHPSSGVDPASITDYVTTYVNSSGEESAPGPVYSASTTHPYAPPQVYTPQGQGDFNWVLLRYTQESATDGYDIVAVRLYRAATGSSGTVFRFVTEIPISYFGGVAPNYVYGYIDYLTDTQLGEVLQSTIWDLPPSDMKGILALPNGVMAGFSKNNLCLSAQNHPHAWPVDYQLTTDTNIVGIGAIDTTVVVWTESYPYIALGNDPSQYSMTKFEFTRACVSKRSIAFMRSVGVIGATSLGLEAIQGVGQIINLTDTLFTYQQWQALVPSSIMGVVHNNVYFFFYDTGSVKGGYALDMSPTGFGLIPLSFYATAAYNDPKTDQLFLVLSEVDEPTDGQLQLPSTAPTPDGATVYEFDSPSGSGNMVYRYRGRLSLLERPAAFQFAQLKADDFTNIVLRLYANGSLIYHQAISAETEFTLPMDDDYTTIEWELIGTSTVRSIQLGEVIDELGLVPTSVQYNAT